MNYAIGVDSMNRNLQRIARVRGPERVRRFQVKLGIDGLQSVVFLSPVDLGQLRNGWEVGINGDPSLPRNPPNDRGGRQAISRGVRRMQKAPRFSRFVIANGTPQAFITDQGGFVPKNPGPSKDKRPGRKGRTLVRRGYSVQAPNGMVRIAARRMRTTAVRAARAVRREVL